MAQKNLNIKKVTYFSLKNSFFSLFLKLKFINSFMKKGLKSKSEKNFNLFLKLAYKKIKKNVLFFFKYVLKNSSVVLNIKKIAAKKKKFIKEIPFFLKKPLRLAYAIKTIKINSNKNKQKKNYEWLFLHCCDVMKKSHPILTNNQILLQESLKKKIYAHFRWF